jgi:hypothetical protein
VVNEEALTRAFDHKHPGLAQLLVDPFLDPLRGDPRFIELMKELGFVKTL